MQTLLHLHPMTDGRSVILTFREIALTNPTLFRKHLRLSFLPHSTPLTYRKATRRRLCQLSIALPGSISTNPLRHQLDAMLRGLNIIKIGLARCKKSDSRRCRRPCLHRCIECHHAHQRSRWSSRPKVGEQSVCTTRASPLNETLLPPTNWPGMASNSSSDTRILTAPFPPRTSTKIKES